MAEVRFELKPEKYVASEAKPNLPVLGAKLKGNKAFKDIQNSIKSLNYDQIVEAKEKGEIELHGVKLNVKEDLIITDKYVNTNIKEHEAIGGDNIL